MNLELNSPILLVSDDTVKNIRKIYELDKPDRLEEAITILEDWIKKQDHIIKKDFKKDYLEKTLVSTKGSVEKAKKQIDRICTMRTLVPKYFTSINFKLEMQDLVDFVSIAPMPKLTKDNYRIILTKFHKKTVTNDLIWKYYRCSIMISEYIKKNDYTNGFLMINDYRNLNIIDSLTAINTVELQQFVTILMEGYGARIKSIHIITESKAIELFIKTIKQFVSEKIGNRMCVHNNMDTLPNVVDIDIISSDYGGKEKTLQELNKQILDEISSDEYLEYMKMMNKACTDETRRNDAKFNEEILGMPGSFRTLKVD